MYFQHQLTRHWHTNKVMMTFRVMQDLLEKRLEEGPEEILLILRPLEDAREGVT